MSQVAVFNDNIYPYKETFRGTEIEIKEKGHIMMDEDEAKLFLGQYAPPVLDADGNQMPQGFKMLKILGKEKLERRLPQTFKCNACALECKSQEDLEAHIIAAHVEDLPDSTDEERKVKAEYEKKAAAQKKDIYNKQAKVQKKQKQTYGL